MTHSKDKGNTWSEPIRVSPPGLQFSLFETSAQADESDKVAKNWISDENFGMALPNAPKITSGKVVAHSDRVLVAA